MQKNQKYFDNQISKFIKSKETFTKSLKKHLDIFMPLSDEDEEKDYKKILKILKKYKTL